MIAVSVRFLFRLPFCSSIEKGKEDWNTSSSTMYSALRDAVIRARTDGELSADDAQTFIRSGRLTSVNS